MSAHPCNSIVPHVTDSGAHYFVNILRCWLACEDEDTRPLDLHVGRQQPLEGSEGDVVSGDIASDPSDIDVL